MTVTQANVLLSNKISAVVNFDVRKTVSYLHSENVYIPAYDSSGVILEIESEKHRTVNGNRPNFHENLIYFSVCLCLAVAECLRVIQVSEREEQPVRMKCNGDKTERKRESNSVCVCVSATSCFSICLPVRLLLPVS